MIDVKSWAFGWRPGMTSVDADVVQLSWVDCSVHAAQWNHHVGPWPQACPLVEKHSALHMAKHGFKLFLALQFNFSCHCVDFDRSYSFNG